MLNFWEFTLTNILHGNTILLMLTQVSRSLLFSKQVKNFLPRDSMQTLYFASVHSHYIYGILALGNATKTALHHSIVLQKWALRIINNANYNGHTYPLFKAS